MLSIWGSELYRKWLKFSEISVTFCIKRSHRFVAGFEVDWFSTSFFRVFNLSCRFWTSVLKVLISIFEMAYGTTKIPIAKRRYPKIRKHFWFLSTLLCCDSGSIEKLCMNSLNEPDIFEKQIEAHVSKSNLQLRYPMMLDVQEERWTGLL